MLKVFIPKKDKWIDYFTENKLSKVLSNEKELLSGGGNYVEVTGTVDTNTNKTNIVVGGKTIILTLSASTWVTAGATFDAQRQNIINGLDSDKSEANGWDAVVKATLPVTAVVRTSNTVVTITLPAFSTYNITEQEKITVTVPSTAVSSPVENTDYFIVYASSRRLPTAYTEHTYDSAGGGEDYTSLATWEDATDNNLVTGTSGYVLTCTAGVHDDSVIIAGATTNASYFRVIRAVDGSKGTPTSGVRIFSSATATNSVVVSSTESYFNLQDICLGYSTDTTSLRMGFVATNSYVIGCIFYGNSGTNYTIGFRVSGGCYLINCLAMKSGSTSFAIGFQNLTGTNYYYNCTSTQNKYGVWSNTGTSYAKNCIFQDNTVNTNGTWTQTTCATSGVTFQADGYHLDSTDTGAIDQGTDLSGDGSFAFDDDIDGETRDDWDIGCDEYVSASNDFVIAGLSSTPTIENIALTQASGTFAIDGLSSTPTIENIELSLGGGSFEIADLSSTPTIENITLNETGLFEIADLTSQPTIENIVLVQASGEFVIANLSSTPTIENITLTMSGEFVIDDVVSTPTIENIVLELASGEFVIDDLSSTPTIENITLVSQGTFEISNIESTPTIEEITLILNSGLFEIANIESTPTIENITLEFNSGTFEIASVVSEPTIENITLNETGTFAIDSVSSTPTIEEIVLVLNSGVFEIDDLLSTPTAENIELIFNGGTFEIQDCNSPPTIENITIEFEGGTFEIQNLESNPTIENIQLTRPSNFTEAQLGEIISLIVAIHEGLK